MHRKISSVTRQRSAAVPRRARRLALVLGALSLVMAPVSVVSAARPAQAAPAPAAQTPAGPAARSPGGPAAQAPAAPAAPLQRTVVDARGQVKCLTAACPRIRVSAPKRPGATGPAKARPGTANPQFTGLFWALQMNLCNSGKSDCYSMNMGQSVPEAYGVISNWLPDLVTLNEICQPDIDTLWPALENDYPGDWTFEAFFPAVDGNNPNPGPEHPILCGGKQANPQDVNQPYGNGVLGHVPAADWIGLDGLGGIYGNQPAASASNEWRTWMCMYAIGNYYGCATHLTNISGTVAMAQCHEFMDQDVPYVWSYEGVYYPTVGAGDLNLKYAGSPNAQDCVPAGWYRKGDGAVQHVMATDEFGFDSTQVIDMTKTDHDALLVQMSLP